MTTTLPTGASPKAIDSVGSEGGGASWGGNYAALELARLQTDVEFMRFCSRCNSDTRFIAQIEMLNGLYGCCAQCGEESVAPYTRTVEPHTFTEER